MTPTILPTITTSVSTSDRDPVPRDQRRIDQHADRDEEDRREHVAHRLDQVLDRLRLARLGDERAGDERAERDRVAERRARAARRAKQMPMLATSVVSGRSSRTIARIARGTTSRPTATSADQERDAACPRVASSAGAETPAPRRDRGEHAISRIAIRSSTISTPTTSSRSSPRDALLVERLGDDRRARDRDRSRR